MKKILLALVVGLALVAQLADAGQNLNISLGGKTPTGAAVLVTTDSLGDTIVARGISTTLNVSGNTVIKNSAGRVAKINVLSASGAISVYDSATVASAVAAVEIAVIPATIGVYELDFPTVNGLTVLPASSVLSISYQ